MANALLAASFIDEARLRTHLGRDAGGEDDIEQRLAWACNRAIAWMEMRTARRLKARNHRTQVTTTTSGSTAADATSINVASTASIKVGDDVLCAGLDVGVTVQSITSSTAFVPSKKVLATIATGTTMTFGSKPLVVRVDDGHPEAIYCPESPLLEANLFALYFVDGGSVRSAIPLTYMDLEESTGRLALNGFCGLSGPFGAGRYEFECRAGYEQPSATALGDPNAWEALCAIQLRAAEVFFSDDNRLIGRSSALTVSGVTVSGDGSAMPADIEHALRPFWRVGA